MVTLRRIKNAPLSHDEMDANFEEIAGKAPVSHTHGIAGVTGLQAALDSKISSINPTTSGGLTHTGNASFKGSVIINTAGGGLGYGLGVGGGVIQPTSKSTNVTLNKLCGVITTHSESLAAGASAVFGVNNSTFQVGDLVVPMLANGPQGDNMLVHVWAIGPGVFFLNLKNTGVSAQAFAVDIYFTIIKGATS